MSTLLGMDVNGGHQASRTLLAGSDQITQTTVQLTQALDSFEWHGQDANRTREEWRNQYVTTLNQIAEQVRVYGDMIRAQAEEQELASQS